jgi:hypothetical protein
MKNTGLARGQLCVFDASVGQDRTLWKSRHPGCTLFCALAEGWGERGEAASPGPPGTKGLTLSPPASSGEEGQAPGPDPSPGPALTSPFTLHFGWAHTSEAFSGGWHL